MEGWRGREEEGWGGGVKGQEDGGRGGGRKCKTAKEEKEKRKGEGSS